MNLIHISILLLILLAVVVLHVHKRWLDRREIIARRLRPCPVLIGRG